jgi:hypothetical protein
MFEPTNIEDGLILNFRFLLEGVGVVYLSSFAGTPPPPPSPGGRLFDFARRFQTPTKKYGTI